MIPSLFLPILLFTLVSVTSGVAIERQRDINERRALTPYAPIHATCPSTLVRTAKSALSASESSWRQKRIKKANTALASWLKRQSSAFETSNLPVVGLTSSGGGYRAMLVGGGVVQSLDSRDSNTSVSGLYQALTYHAGLSGGSWLLSSIAGNNYPTISSLRDGLWEVALQDSLLIPDNLLVADAYADVSADIISKEAAGFNVTLTDPWGRLLSYQFLYGPDGGVAKTVSSIRSMSSFANQNAPYPIITSLGVQTFEGECEPDLNATQYEFHPFEFGSWDEGVKAMVDIKYLGSKLSKGKPVTSKVCVENYDNLGYVLGTSSTLFNEACALIPADNSSTNLDTTLEGIVAKAKSASLQDLYATYPNPFFKYAASTWVSAQPVLNLVDGGEALQNNPVWPFLHNPLRANVLLVNDNSADTTTNYPNGTELRTTYEQALLQGKKRMPFIPTTDIFVAEGLNTRATFFGCNESNALTVVYLPNVGYNGFDSGTSTEQLEYPVAQTDAMIEDGVAVGDQDGDEGWGLCLACAIMKKTGGKLPGGCTACFEKYCYVQ